VVDVRHIKGKIDHPHLKKKNGTSGGKTCLLGLATGSTIIHTTFYVKKTLKNVWELFLK
jgi:hypothetical protein